MLYRCSYFTGAVNEKLKTKLKKYRKIMLEAKLGPEIKKAGNKIGIFLVILIRYSICKHENVTFHD